MKLKPIEHYGRLDTWVHAAGTAIIAPFEQVMPEEFQRVIDVYGRRFALAVAERLPVPMAG
jgi:NAD(P)-dependent dehydrogenase (short-subunit alcohol dehydrogenase family)